MTQSPRGNGWRWGNDSCNRQYGYEGEKWVCYFWISGFSHVSIGVHFDWYNPNFEIHVPFGFVRFGIRESWRAAVSGRMM